MKNLTLSKEGGSHFLSFLKVAVTFLLISGCTSEFNLATEQEESLIFGTDKEVQIGAAVARQFDEHFKISSDVELNERAERVLKRIVEVCDRKDVVYTIKVIDEDLLNAVSLPGGHIYVYRGIMEKAKTDDQLAGVISHEVGHITARHGIKRLQASYGFTLLQLAAVSTKSAKVAQGVSTAYLSVFLEYSRQDEFEADRLGVKYMQKAGYTLSAMTDVLEILREEQQDAPAREISYWRTHPHLSERVANVNKNIKGELEFRDYLNLIGNE